MKSMMKIATTACLGVHGAQGLMLKRSQVAVVSEMPMEHVDHEAAVAALFAVFAGHFDENQIRAALEHCDGNADAATEHLLNPVPSEPAAITADTAAAPLTAVAAPTAVQDLLDAPGAGMDTIATGRDSELQAILAGMEVSVEPLRVKDVLAMYPSETNEQLVARLMTMEDRECAGAARDVQLEEDAALAAAMAAADVVDPETAAAIQRATAEWEEEEARDHAAAEEAADSRGSLFAPRWETHGMPVVHATAAAPGGDVPVVTGTVVQGGFPGEPVVADSAAAAANAAPVRAAELTTVFGQGGEENLVQQRRSSGGRGRKMQMPAALKNMWSAGRGGSSRSGTGNKEPLLGPGTYSTLQ